MGMSTMDGITIAQPKRPHARTNERCSNHLHYAWLRRHVFQAWHRRSLTVHGHLIYPCTDHRMRRVCTAPVYLRLSKPTASQLFRISLHPRSARHLQRHNGTCACAYPGKPQILKEPATRDATLGELLVEISGLTARELQQLVDLGAVYYGDPECPANPPKWRRANRLGAAAMDQHISEVPTSICAALLREPTTGRMHSSSTNAA